MRKKHIPASLREQTWLNYCGTNFHHKCHVTWCTHMMNVFNFEVGHDIPESRGGSLDLSNLRPICSKCNRSMGDEFTIQQFSLISRPRRRRWMCFS